MNTKFLYLPSWVIESILANKGRVTQLLDYEYVKNVLSPADLSEMVFFSRAAGGLLGVDAAYSGDSAVASSDNLSECIVNLWSTLGKGAPPPHSDVEKINDYIAINDCERSLNERLFSTQASNQAGKSFETIQFDLGVIGVVIYPGAFTPGQSDENRFVLIRTLVLELTRLHSQPEVASTLLMRRYIELLSAR